MEVQFFSMFGITSGRLCRHAWILFLRSTFLGLIVNQKLFSRFLPAVSHMFLKAGISLEGERVLHAKVLNSCQF